jgi:hypothetical protein
VIGLTVRVTNSGTTPLTGITVDTPEVPSCTGPVPDLDPGEHHDLTCDHDTTVADVGTFTSTAEVDSAETVGPLPAEPVAVTVLDPSTAALEVTQATEQDTVLVGEDIDLTVTLANTGAVPLTGVTLTTPEVSGCTGPADDLDPGEEVTVDCSYTTVDPSDIGTFTSTASATAGQVLTPVVAPEADVNVLAPDRTLPTISIVSPVNGIVVDRGSIVPADYSCADDSGWASCVGSVPDGQPIDTSTPGQESFVVVARDLAGDEITLARTYTVVDRRPDGRIRQGVAGPTVGDGRYNLTGAGQNRTTWAARGTQVTYFVTVQNDGSHPEKLRVKGQPGTTHFPVRYWSGGVDITTPVRNATYVTPTMAPGAVRTIKVVVTVGPRAPVNSQIDRLVTISSTESPTRKDVVRFIVKRR